MCGSNATELRDYSGKNVCKSGITQQIISSTKARQKWRPVIGLSVPNRDQSVPTFKMETSEVIRNSIGKGE